MAKVRERGFHPVPAVDLRAVGTGIAAIFLLTVLAAAILAVGIYLTDITEAHVSGALYYVGLVAVACGGATASRLAGTRGWLHGGLAGLGYVLLSLLLGLILFPGSQVLGDIAEKLLTGTVVGVVGGVIGLNL